MKAKPNQRMGGRQSEPDPVGQAGDHGIDIAQLRDNLALTPAERMRRHDIALSTVEMLRKARRHESPS
jgi:hypothetical protein